MEIIGLADHKYKDYFKIVDDISLAVGDKFFVKSI